MLLSAENFFGDFFSMWHRQHSSFLISVIPGIRSLHVGQQLYSICSILVQNFIKMRCCSTLIIMADNCISTLSSSGTLSLLSSSGTLSLSLSCSACCFCLLRYSRLRSFSRLVRASHSSLVSVDFFWLLRSRILVSRASR